MSAGTVVVIVAVIIGIVCITYGLINVYPEIQKQNDKKLIEIEEINAKVSKEAIQLQIEHERTLQAEERTKQIELGRK